MANRKCLRKCYMFHKVILAHTFFVTYLHRFRLFHFFAFNKKSWSIYYLRFPKAIPCKVLTAAVAITHIFPIKRAVAAWADGIGVSSFELNHFSYLQWNPERFCGNRKWLTPLCFDLFQGHFAVPPKTQRDSCRCKSGTKQGSARCNLFFRVLNR